MQQTNQAENERRIKALTAIAKRIAEIQEEAVKSQDTLIAVAKAIFESAKEGTGSHGTILDHAEKIIGQPATPGSLSQCQQDFRNFEQAAATAAKTNNWVPVEEAWAVYTQCTRTLRPIRI